MVGLVVDRDLAVVEPLDHIGFPERPAAVEQARMQPRDIFLELLEGSRARQDHMANVVVEVDVLVVDPDRIGQVEGHQRELALEHRREMDARGHVTLHVLVVVAVVALGQIEDLQAAHMHRHLGRFEMQERSVHSAQVIHRLSP
jgi:hypothetical protein